MHGKPVVPQEAQEVQEEAIIQDVMIIPDVQEEEPREVEVEVTAIIESTMYLTLLTVVLLLYL